MSHRVEQIESMLQRAISEVIQRRIADPRIGGLVSITQVKTATDLTRARVYVSVLPIERQSTVLHGLRNAAPHIQMLLRKQVSLRHIPRLEFELDQTLKKQAAVYEAIREADRRAAPSDSGPGELSQVRTPPDHEESRR